MNKIEYEMVDLLKCLRDDFGVFEIKAEFEAEGTRLDPELMRLKEVISCVELPLILKIGGVEAISDVYTALTVGVKGIVAPMAETPYALSKYLGLIKNMIPPDNRQDIEFAFNLETITGYENFNEMLALPDFKLLTGVTIGRVDLTGSMGLGRGAINTSKEVLNICEEVMSKSRKAGLKTAMGGGIEVEALPIIQKLEEAKLLYKFETRKVVFPASAWKHGEAAILKAVEFELLWLKSKRRYYGLIRDEDEKRITMLSKRLEISAR